MSYIFDRVYGELLQRIGLGQNLEQEGAQRGIGRRWLIVDFQGSTLQTEIYFQNIQCETISLLEGGIGLADNAMDESAFDGVLINLQLAWLDHLEIFTRVRRWLSPGGRLYFSTLGPDTLFELREGWEGVDTMPHVHPFVDMHHLGDQLIRSGFIRPILDADWFGVEYDDIDLLMDDLRGEGFHNVLADRRKTLTGKGRVDGLRRCFMGRSVVQMTYELIYGYAEAPSETTAGIRVDLPRRTVSNHS